MPKPIRFLTTLMTLAPLVLLPTQGAAHFAQTKNPKESAVVCTVEAVPDTWAQVPAFTYLLPKGWKDNSSFKWNANGSGIMAAVPLMIAQSPDKQYRAVVMEGIQVSYMKAAGHETGFPLTQATDFAQRVLEIQTKQGWTITDVVKQINTNMKENQTQKMMDQSARNGGLEQATPLHQTGLLQVKMTTPAGIQMLVTVRTAVNGSMSQFNSGMGSGNWSVNLEEVIRPVDATPHGISSAWTPIKTFGITPEENEFGALVVKANNRIMGNKFTFQNQMKWHDQVMKQFEAEMHSKDADSHNYNNYILDNSDYQGPDGKVLTLPNHEKAWKNGNDVLFSDDPTFDPKNYGSTYKDWTPLKKVKAK